MLRCDRKQQNSVKQLSFNKKNKKKRNAVRSIAYEDLGNEAGWGGEELSVKSLNCKRTRCVRRTL